MNIRNATIHDVDGVRDVHLMAFPEGEGAVVSKLAVELLAEGVEPPVISLIAEADGVVAGHVALSPVTFEDCEELTGYILAPLAVKPELQKRCIGSELIEYGVRQLIGMGVAILFVYGDPNYYGRFGFSADAAERFVPPYALKYPFGWQVKALKEFNIGMAVVKVGCVSSLCDPELW